MENFLVSKKPHLDIIYFQLQWMYSCEAVGKGVCITRIGTGQKLQYIHINSVHTL